MATAVDRVGSRGLPAGPRAALRRGRASPRARSRTDRKALNDMTDAAHRTGGCAACCPSHGRRAPARRRRSLPSTGGFWGARQAVNATATLAHCESLDGAARLAGQLRPCRRRYDRRRPAGLAVLRLRGLQAAGGAVLGGTAAPATRTRRPRSSGSPARVARAQDADGYLNTCFGHGGQRRRYSDLETGHELYNIGHLLQAAVARLRTSGEDDLVGSPGGPPTTCADDVRPGRPGQRSAATRRSRWVWPSSAAPSASRATSSRPALFLDRRGHGTLADDPAGPRLLPGRHPHPRRRGLARPRRARPVPDGRGGRRGRRSRRRRTAAPPSSGSGSARSPAAPTSPAAWARGTRTRASARTGSCRRTAPTARPAPASPRSWCPGACSWPPATSATPTSSSAPSTTSSRPPRAPTGAAFFYANPLHQRAPGRPRRPGRGQPARRGRRPGRLVRRLLLPHQRRPYPGRPPGLSRHHRRRRPPDPPVRHRRDPRRTARRAAASPWASRPATPRPAPSASASPPTPAGPWTLTLRVPAWAAGATLTDEGRTREVAPGLARDHADLPRGRRHRPRPAGASRASPGPTRASTPYAAASPSNAAPRSCVSSPATSPAPTGLDALVIDPPPGLRAEPGGARGRALLPAQRRPVLALRPLVRPPPPGTPDGSTSRCGPTTPGPSAVPRPCVSGCPRPPPTFNRRTTCSYACERLLAP